MRPLVHLSSVLALALLASTSARAQLVIHEVLLDPVGPDANRQILEIYNEGGSLVTPTNWYLVVGSSFAPLPAIAIPADTYVRVHIGATSSNVPTDFFLPPNAWNTYRDLQASDTAALWVGNCFTCDGGMRDFVSWGGGTDRAQQAVNVGQWTAVGDTVPIPTIEGASIALRGSGDTPEAWFRDASPTLGSDNGQDFIQSFGGGCPTSRGVPSIAAARPAVDGALDFAVSVQGGEPNGLGAFIVGLTGGGGSLIFLGCVIEPMPLVVVPAALDGTGSASLPLPLYSPPLSLGGATLWFQGVAIDPAASNGLFGLTSGLVVGIGN